MNKRIIAGLVVGGVAVAGAAVGIGIGLSPQMYEVKIESEQEEARFDGSGKYKIGQQVELLAEAPEGYEFAYWLFNDTAVSEENPYIFKLTKENFGTYTAVFSKQLSVTVDQGISHGQVSSSVEKTIAGKEVTVTVTPDEHYRLSKLYYEVADDENEYNINMQTFKFDMPEKDVIIHAEFTDCIYSVSTAQGISNGQLTIVPVEGKNGTEVIVTPSADTGYYLKDLFYVKEGDEENPVTIEENEDVYSFILSSNVTVHATFLQIEYEIAEFSQNVTLKKGEQVLTKDDTLHYNDEIEVTYTVPEGYHLTNFGVTGLQKVEGEDNLYKVIGNVSIDYQIEIDTFAINFAEGEGFVLEPVGQVDLDNIAYDTNFKFTITLDEGYDQSNYVVKVNNQVVEEVDGMFTINVRGNKNITVEGVELNTYTVPEFSSRVTIRKNDNIISAGDTLTYGDELVITYSESYGHTMTEFSVQGVERVEGKENTYKVVGDLSITYAEEVSKYTVTLTQGTGYTLSSEDDLTEIEHGSSISISLTIDDEYNQSTPVVKANGGTISGNGDGTYTIQVLDDLTITVEGVEINKYSVTLTEGEGYYYIPNYYGADVDLASVEHGTRIYVYLKLEDEYNQSNPTIKANGQVLTHGQTVFSFVVNEDSVVIVEDVEINRYDVTLSQGVGYELQTEDLLEDVAHGSSISFTLALGEGYNQSTPVVKANGEVIYADEGTYTVEITEDTTITVEDVEINNYSVTLTEGTGYTLAVVGEVNLDEVEYNSNVSFTLTLDDNYNQSTPVVKVNNEAIEANDGVYTINVKEDKVVTVSDVQGNVYHVLSFDDEYVTITKDGEPVTVSDDLRYGDEITIAYELDEGYEIKTFEVEGATPAEGRWENLYIVTGDITITFEQEIMSFSLTIINENQFPIGFKDQDIDLSEIEYGTEVLIYADSIADGDLEYYAIIVDENGQVLADEWDSDDQKYYVSLTITENTTISVIDAECIAALSGFNSEFMVKEGDGNSFIIYDNNDNPTHFGVEYYYDEDEQVGKYVGMIGVGIPLNYDTSQMTLTLGDEVIEPVDVIEGIQLGPDTYGNAFIYNIEMNQNGLILSLNNVQIQTFDINIYDEDGENILYTDEVEYGKASQYKDLTFTKESDDPNYVYQFMGFAELDGFKAVDLTNITKDLDLRPVFMQRAVLEYELNENEDGYILKSWYYAGTDREETITIPAEYQGLPVTEIGEGAFALPQTIGAEKLNYVTPYTPNLKVNLPSTIQKIGYGAFYNCPQVDVDFTQFDNLTEIGDSAFQGTAVKKVILDKIERIGACAFASCQALTEISIPSTLERLGTTFEYYTTLGKTGYQYTSKYPGLQPGVEPTDVYTFADCVKLAKVDWEASVYPSGYIFENSGSASGIEFTLAGNVTIAPDLYNGRISELHILADELVDGETRSEIEHLSSCSAESIIVDSASVAQAILGDNNNLSDLSFTKLYIANGLDDGTQQTISFSSFDATQAATSDKAGYVLYDAEIVEISVGNMYYTKDDENHTLIVNGFSSCYAPRIKIPETVEIDDATYTVTQVYIDRYYDEVTLPGSLSYVSFGNGFGEVELYGTGTNLTYTSKILYVDNGEEVIAVGASNKLSSDLMLRDDVTIIGAGAFANTNITSVNWSDLAELRMIGQGAFYMTQHLDEVIIPEGVTTILPNAFCGCGATYVSVPESVETLYMAPEDTTGGGILVSYDPFYTFAGMTNLKTLVWDAAYINDISVMANPEIFAGSGCAEGVEVTFGEHANDLSIFTGASTYSGDYSNILYGIPMRIKKLTITQDGSRNEEGYPFNAQGSINVFNIGLLPNAEVIIDSEMLAEGLLDMGVAGMLFNLYDMYYPGSYNTSTWEWEADYSEANIKLYINDEFLEETIQSEIVGAGDGISVVFTHNASTDKEGYQLYNLSYISKSGNGGGSGGGATPIFVP